MSRDEDEVVGVASVVTATSSSTPSSLFESTIFPNRQICSYIMKQQKNHSIIFLHIIGSDTTVPHDTLIIREHTQEFSRTTASLCFTPK